MATHYENTTVTKNHKSYGVYQEYKNIWYNFAIAVTISAAGAVSYTITSTNNASAIKGWNGCRTSAWIEINGTTVLSAGWHSSGFPRDNNSTKSGSAGTTTTGSVTIKTKIIPGSNYTGWTTEWNNSLISSTASRTYWTDVGVGKITSFTDHYNNSYSVTGERGAAGTNNAVTSAKLWYGTGTGSGAYSTSNFGSGKTAHSAANVSVTPTTDAERKIYVAVTTVGTKTTTASDTGWIEKKIRQYLPPKNPTSITLDNSSLRNDRLTIKQDWKYNWSGASRINASCPIKGYRYCLEKQSAGTTTWTKVALKNSSGNALSGKMSGSNEYDTTSTSATFSPSQSGIVAGDKVRFRVKAFTKYGYNNDGKILENSSYATSAESTVQNAGVMRVCVKKGNKLQWVEGVVHVYVKKNNKLQWIEADIVKTYKSKSWKEST